MKVHMFFKKSIVVAVLVFALFASVTSVFAKRLDPTSVDMVTYDGVAYTAPVDDPGYVEARDTASDKLLWKKQVYEVSYDENLEKDVQDVHIAQLKATDSALLVIDERGTKYLVDLKTGSKVREEDRASQNSNITLPEKPKYMFLVGVGLAVTLVLVCIFVCSRTNSRRVK